MSGTEWAQKLPDDVLERFWRACLQAKDAIQDATRGANWSLGNDLTFTMTREHDAWLDLAIVLKQEMERREYEPQEVQS